MLNKFSPPGPRASTTKERGFIIGQDLSSTIVKDANTQSLSAYYYLPLQEAIDGHNKGFVSLYDPGIKSNSASINDIFYLKDAHFTKSEAAVIPITTYPFRAVMQVAEPSSAGSRYEYNVYANDGTFPAASTYRASTDTITMVGIPYVQNGTGVVSNYNYQTANLTYYSNVNLGVGSEFVYNAITYDSNVTYLFTANGNVSYTTNNGITWNQANRILPAGQPDTGSYNTGAIFTPNYGLYSLYAESSYGVELWNTANAISTPWISIYKFSGTNYFTFRYGPVLDYSTQSYLVMGGVPRLGTPMECWVYKYWDAGSLSGTKQLNFVSNTLVPTSIAWGGSSNCWVMVGYYYNPSTGHGNTIPKILVTIDDGTTWRAIDTRHAESNAIINCASLSIFSTADRPT